MRHAAAGARWIALPLLLAACTAGQTGNQNAQIAGSAREPSPATRDAGYFPLALTQTAISCPRAGPPPVVAMSATEMEWFGTHLAAAREPSLYRRSQEARAAHARTLRFTWLPTFHNTVTVRIESEGASHRIVAKRLSGAGGYDPGTIQQEIERPLTRAETERLDQTVARTGLFAMPTRDCAQGLDGSEWVFEAADNSGYRVVRRWTPDDGPAREVGALLLELTGWRFEEIY